jgi:dTDP-4-amino-4,6-dideoxygalactose transaminase
VSTSVPLLDLKAQYVTIEAEVKAAIDRVMSSQHFILGPEVEGLEREVAEYCRCAHGIGVTSGTDAILIALMALGIGPGDEVITTPYTFIATVGSIARMGARPVLVDIDPETFNLDLSQVERAITPRTRAIMPVHLYGQMVDLPALQAIARDIPIIEDAAQAIGAEWKGARAGSLGTMGCLSFFPSKNLGGAGDGGMVVTNDANLAKKLRLLRNQGQSPKYFSQIVGGNFRLDALQAAILRAKLPHLDSWTAARQRNAARYRQLFGQAQLQSYQLSLPAEQPGVRHVYNQFVIRCVRRDALKTFLGDRGIGSEIYYPQPMHLQTCFAHLGYKQGDFPHSENAAVESLALPIYPELTEAQQALVVQAVLDFQKT